MGTITHAHQTAIANDPTKDVSADAWNGVHDFTLNKTDVGLANVDNTSDANKPVSTAAQTALNLKAPLASPAFTGNPTAPTPAPGDNDTSIATTAFVAAAVVSGVGAAPNLATWLQAKVDAGQPADWVWGNYVIPAAITINWNATLSGFRWDGHGATFSAGFTNTAVNLITFTVPDGAPVNTNIMFPQIANMSLNCAGTKNGLAISCRLNTSYVFGLQIVNVQVFGANESGIWLYGDVFEADIIGCMARDNGRAGLELRNPTAGGTGIISSVTVHGGDYRTNEYGIMTSADTTYQEPAGLYVFGANFIANNSAGILCFAGMKICRDSHFENNCGSNGGETNGAIWNVFGPINIDNCDAASSTSNGQHYLVDCLGQSAQSCHINRSTCINTDTGVGRKIGKLAGSGTLWIGNSIAATDFDATGAWTVNRANVTTTTIP